MLWKYRMVDGARTWRNGNRSVGTWLHADEDRPRRLCDDLADLASRGITFAVAAEADERVPTFIKRILREALAGEASGAGGRGGG